MRFLLFLSLLLVSGCDKIQAVDQMIFKKFGFSFYQVPETVTIKRIHLESGSLAGEEIITKGKVVQIGSPSTYLILRDDDGTLLVVLDGLDHDARRSISLDSDISIWGKLESGKKGLPVLSASAVRDVTKSSM